MPIDPDDAGPRVKTPDFALGQDLSTLSEHELELRVTAMETEIGRCREAIKARQTTRTAAASFFKQAQGAPERD